MQTIATPNSRRPRAIDGVIRPVSITARSIGPYCFNGTEIAPGVLSAVDERG
ncbi:hypothetical protein [Sphingobium indicum]